MIEDIELASWEAFKSGFAEELGSDPKHFIFRGQGDAEWPLQPSFSRGFKHCSAVELEALQTMICDALEEEIGLQGLIQVPKREELWPLGQHYGLPTPLLDWSASPYVAAFFACEPAIEAIASSLEPGDSPANRQFAIYALQQSGDGIKPLWESMGVTFPRPWHPENSRIRYQRGLFTLIPPPYQTLDDCLEKFRHLIPSKLSLIKRFTLPYSEAARTIEDLELMDINARRLYGDLEGACKSAKLRAQISHIDKFTNVP
jgi:hypothetical protein